MTLNIPIVTTNANDNKLASNCRPGVIEANGERQYLTHEIGEPFFSGNVSVT